jgi:integrase
MSAAVKFTDRFLAKYQPKTPRDEIFDKGGNGLGVRVTPKAKTFFFVRRVAGQKARFTLGQYPDTSLAQARMKANELLHRIKQGEDPRGDALARKEAEAEAAENTFATIAQRFMTEYAAGKKTPLRPSTITGYRWALQGEPTAKWASRPVTEIDARDVIRIIDRLEADKHFASALLFRTYLSRFFNWCISKRLIRENPTQGVVASSTPSDFARDRALPLHELRAVLEAADNLGEPGRSFIRMLILTGQRRGETAKMKWSDLTLDGDAPVWKLPKENTKNGKAHEVPLSTEAVAVITSMPRLGEYIFTTNGKTPTGSFDRIKTALDKIITDAGVKLAPWRIHDLRRSVATGMADELGIAPHVIEAALNHVSGSKAGIAGIYNKSRYDAGTRRALAAWAQTVTAKPTDNVVALDRRHA